MNKKITGLHHVTALASEPLKNVDFYAGILGLRMVKKTVNFDAPDIYHLYYGDEQGTPGSIITFFPFPDISKGRKGYGQTTVTSFSIPENALDYWMARLTKFGVSFLPPKERFQREMYIYLEDPDGLGIELVTDAKETGTGFSYGHIPPEFAVRRFYGITLTQKNSDPTVDLLVKYLNYNVMLVENNHIRLSTGDGNFVDILAKPDSPAGLGGSGTVHHVAFATDNDESQKNIREQLRKGGLHVSPVMDRQYFHSIYFREPGGVLFEVATSDIGFTLDEPLESLGQQLKLPPWEEKNRQDIEELLIPVQVPSGEYQD